MANTICECLSNTPLKCREDLLPFMGNPLILEDYSQLLEAAPPYQIKRPGAEKQLLPTGGSSKQQLHKYSRERVDKSHSKKLNLPPSFLSFTVYVLYYTAFIRTFTVLKES